MIKIIQEIKTMKAIRLSSFLFLAVLFALQSCNEKTIFDQVYDFKDNTWTKADTVSFALNVEDTITKHEFIISLRTTKSYLYNNLWMYILVTAPDGSTSKMAQEIPLAHPDGSWTGRVSGTLVESRVRFDSKAFPIPGDYVFKFVNATQEDEIPYISDIGLRIE